MKIAVPDNYSARLEVSTNNGGVHSDFGGMSRDRDRDRDISVQLGGGGAPIKVKTSNGGVKITKK